MNYEDWEPIYQKILMDFSFQVENDIKAAKILDELLSKCKTYSIEKLKKQITGNEVFIFGAGPSLEDSIHKYKKLYIDKLKITADGATSALIENNILPDLIVTDLDGKISDQINANKNGSTALIHAHGDNIDTIQRYIPEFSGAIVGTTQTDPTDYENLQNFGGFTDGDKAVFLADHFKAKKINLLGFDFDGEIGKYSFPEKKDENKKMKKLKWSKYLIDILMEKNQNIYTY